MHACQVASIMSDSFQPYGLYPARLLVHGILQAGILEWVAFLPPGDVPTLHLLCLLHWQAGSLPLVPHLGRKTNGGHGNPLQYSCLKNPHGQRSLVGYSPWGLQESDTTEWLNTAYIYLYSWFIFFVFVFFLCVQLISCNFPFQWTDNIFI